MLQLLAPAVGQQKPWRAMDLPVHDRRYRANNNTGETALINLTLKRCAQGIGTWRCCVGLGQLRRVRQAELGCAVGLAAFLRVDGKGWLN